MRAFPTVLTGLLLLGASIGCASDPVEPPKPTNITRAWELTKCEYRNQADVAQKVDLIADGWVIFLYINDNRDFFYSYTAPGEAEQVIVGTWRIAGSKLILAPAGAGFEWQFTARVQENDMTLKGASAEYDFNNDGIGEAATWNMVMRN